MANSMAWKRLGAVDDQRAAGTDLMLIDVPPLQHLGDAVALTATVEGRAARLGSAATDARAQAYGYGHVFDEAPTKSAGQRMFEGA
jgi:hypothetical protein